MIRAVDLAMARVRAVKLGRIARDPRLWPALRRGVAASVEHARVPFTAPATVLDVGASSGQFAVFAAARWPRARIVSFEPIPAAQARYAAAMRGRAVLHPVAVGAAPGRATLHVAAADDSSSLLPITERQIASYPGTQEQHTLEVDVVTLDDHLDRDLPAPWLLKIDVQGFELEVLRGATATLERVGQIYVECSFVELYGAQALADEVIAFLFERGFRLAGVHNVDYHGGHAVQADLLFSRAGSAR